MNWPFGLVTALRDVFPMACCFIFTHTRRDRIRYCSSLCIVADIAPFSGQGQTRDEKASKDSNNRLDSDLYAFLNTWVTSTLH